MKFKFDLDIRNLVKMSFFLVTVILSSDTDVVTSLSAYGTMTSCFSASFTYDCDSMGSNDPFVPNLRKINTFL